MGIVGNGGAGMSLLGVGMDGGGLSVSGQGSSGRGGSQGVFRRG